MDIEHKAFNASIKAEPEGIVEAIVSVFSNTDHAGEKVMPGAFIKSISGKLPKLVWQHDWKSPVGKTLEMRELPPGDPRLPPKLSALGGLYAKGQLNLKTQRGKEAYEDLAFGAIDEFSIGYSVVKDSVEEKSGVRELHELLLYEWSPVLVGMNSETELLGLKSQLPPASGDTIDPTKEPATFAYQADYTLVVLKAFMERAKALYELRAKEGRVLSTANRGRIKTCLDSMQGLAADLEALLVMTEPAPAKAAEAEVKAAYTEYLQTVSRYL
jgi:HK97 family phage prohead protease